jgi:histidinol dehydrogenase
MNVIRHSDADYADRLHRLTQPSSLFDPAIEKRVRTIIEAVRRDGDRALIRFARRFDQVTLYPDQITVSVAEKLTAAVKADAALRGAVAAANRNIIAFSRRSVRRDWSTHNRHGAKVGEKFDPFERVGIYIPGGTAPLVSTALMTVSLAKVAGCREIVVCTPCAKNGSVNPALLFAAQEAGATEIYRVGGAQAIAALALGTQTIRRVQKVFGPGNAYVVTAKRLLFGHVAIDLLPGPSEVLVLADDTAVPKFVAADILAQAEHGSGHERVWLVTTAGGLITAVKKEIDKQLTALTRTAYVQRVLEHNAWLIQVKTLDDGLRLANELAPEHCEVMTRNSSKVARQLFRAGAIFLGDYSPTVLGDYVAGPSHELPTGGAGASFAGLTVDQFQRRTSMVTYDRHALGKALGAVRTLASIEGLTAHAHSAAIRLEPTGK